MSYWQTFITLLNSVPAVIWSGAIGALIAAGVSYFSVRSSNTSSLERLREQHAHDLIEAAAQRMHGAQQKDEDRKAAIRREVYTKAAEEAHAVFGAIGGFPDRSLADRPTDMDTLRAFPKACAKAWLVAEVDPRYRQKARTRREGVRSHHHDDERTSRVQRRLRGKGTCIRLVDTK